MTIPKETIIRFIEDYLKSTPKHYPPNGSLNHYYIEALKGVAKFYEYFDYDQFLMDHCESPIVLYNLLDRKIKYKTFFYVCDKIIKNPNFPQNVGARFIDSCIKRYLKYEQATDLDKAKVVMLIMKYGHNCKTTDNIINWLPEKPENITDEIYKWGFNNMDTYYFILYFLRNDKRKQFVPSKPVFLEFLSKHMSPEYINTIAEAHGKFDVKETNTLLRYDNMCNFNDMTIDFNTFDDELLTKFVSMYYKPSIPDKMFKNFNNYILSDKCQAEDIFKGESHQWVSTYTLKWYRGVIDADTIQKLIDSKKVCNNFKIYMLQNSIMLKHYNWDSIVAMAILAVWTNDSSGYSLPQVDMNPAARDMCAKEIIKRNPIAAYEILYKFFGANGPEVEKWFIECGYNKDYLEILKSC